MLTSDEIEREVIAYVENCGLREQLASKSELLQQLAEHGTDRPYVLAALDRLVDQRQAHPHRGRPAVWVFATNKEGSGGN